MTKVLNFFAGPGTGKSTTAADVFAGMKWRNINAELIGEYAKEITWEGRKAILDDQLYMTAKQNRKLVRLQDQVDWIISDSPLILALAYVKPEYHKSFAPLVKELYDSYDNVNILLERVKPYHATGRNQTEAQARELDVFIENILLDNGYEFHRVVADETARDRILEIINVR